MSILLRETSLASMIDFIVLVYHSPLRQNIGNIECETLQLIEEYGHKFPEMKDVGELLRQFKAEVLEHMDREEREFFPIIKQIEKCALGQADYTQCDLQKFEDIIHRLEMEHVHFDTYIFDLVDIFRNSRLRLHNVFVYDHFHNYYTLLENEITRHTEMENTRVHPLAKILFKKVCHIL